MKERRSLEVLAERMAQLLAAERGAAAVWAAYASDQPEDLGELRHRLSRLGEGHFELPDRPRPEQVASRAALERAWSLIGSPEKGEWRGSLAHSAGGALAVVQRTAKPIGIDLERFDRQISEGVGARIAHPEDRVAGLPPIGLWAAKEALYKAGAAERFSAMRVCLAFERPIWTGEAESESGVYRLTIAAEGEWLAAVALS